MTISQIEQRQKFPWRRLFRLAMAHGISPDNVWAMTPAEVLAGLQPARMREEAASGDDILAALMRHHADVNSAENSGFSGQDGAQQ